MIKFTLPKISPKDEMEGVHFVDAEPQTDILGQPLSPQDIVIYGASGRRSGNLEIGKVLGVWTRRTPGRSYDETMVQIAMESYGGKLHKQSVHARALVKIDPNQHKLISKALIEG